MRRFFETKPQRLTAASQTFAVRVLQADEEVHQQLAAAEVPPFFALGWFITWFAHSVDSLPHISRLFDLFMAAHPLMPLYATAVVIKVVTLLAHQCTIDQQLIIFRVMY